MHADRIILPTLLCIGVGLWGCTGKNPNAEDGGADGGGNDLSMSTGDGGGGGGDLSTGGGDDLSTGGGGDLSGGQPDMTMAGPVAHACGDLAMATCTQLNSCNSQALKTGYGNMTTCMAREQLTCPSRVMASGTSLTADNVEACALALAKISCADFLSNNLPTACQAQAGTVAEGQACGDDWQCVNKYCKLGTNQCGRCGERVAAGSACTVDADCDYGLLCASTMAGRRCFKPGAVGAACSTNGPCLPTLVCNMANHCATPGALGTTCTMNPDTCDVNAGLYCNRATRLCEPVKYAAATETCGLTMTPPVYCTDSATCAQMTNRCVAPAKDGAACGLNSIGCTPPAICQGAAGASTCKVPDPASCK